MSATTRLDAQRRSDQIEQFRRELAQLERERVLVLSMNSARRWMRTSARC